MIDEDEKVLSVDHVDVQGTFYDIILLEDMIKEDGQVGGLDVQNSNIFVDLDLDAKQARCETLIHELCHAYAIKFGDIKEKQVDMITSGIFDFIVHNPELAIDLIKMATRPHQKEKSKWCPFCGLALSGEEKEES